MDWLSCVCAWAHSLPSARWIVLSLSFFSVSMCFYCFSPFPPPLSVLFSFCLSSCPLEGACSKALRMNCSNGNTNTVSCTISPSTLLHSHPHYCFCVCQRGPLFGPNPFHSEVWHACPTRLSPFLHIWCYHSCRSKELGKSKESWWPSNKMWTYL